MVRAMRNLALQTARQGHPLPLLKPRNTARTSNLHRQNDVLLLAEPSALKRSAREVLIEAAREDREVQCVLKRALEVTCATSSFPPSAVG